MATYVLTYVGTAEVLLSLTCLDTLTLNSIHHVPDLTHLLFTYLGIYLLMRHIIFYTHTVTNIC